MVNLEYINSIDQQNKEIKNEIKKLELQISNLKTQIHQNYNLINREKSKRFVLLTEYFEFIKSEPDIEKCFNRLDELDLNVFFLEEVKTCSFFQYMDIDFKKYHEVEKMFQLKVLNSSYLDRHMSDCFMDYAREQYRENNSLVSSRGSCYEDDDFDRNEFLSNWRTYGVEN